MRRLYESSWGQSPFRKVLGVKARSESCQPEVSDVGSPLQVLADGFRPTSILATPRIGISKGISKPLRFLFGI